MKKTSCLRFLFPDVAAAAVLVTGVDEVFLSRPFFSFASLTAARGRRVSLPPLQRRPAALWCWASPPNNLPPTADRLEISGRCGKAATDELQPDAASQPERAVVVVLGQPKRQQTVPNTTQNRRGRHGANRGQADELTPLPRGPVRPCPARCFSSTKQKKSKARCAYHAKCHISHSGPRQIRETRDGVERSSH